MKMLAFFGMPGILEIVLMLMCLAVFSGIVVLVVVLATRRPPADPNLFSCPDCGRPVSVHADSCPQCGCPLQTEFRGDGAEGEG